jgi:hypothetical protein
MYMLMGDRQAKSMQKLRHNRNRPMADTSKSVPRKRAFDFHILGKGCFFESDSK